MTTGFEKIQDAIDRARGAGRDVLTEPEAKNVLKTLSVAVPRSSLATDANSAIEAADKMGYPVVLKVVSPGLAHKSEVRGVALGLKNRAEVRQKCAELADNLERARPGGRIDGFLVEEQAPAGIEVIVGALRDEQFGPVVVFGLGGVAVELLGDVAISLAPVSRAEALELMARVRAYPLLTGYRGRSPADLQAVAEVIVKVSNLAEEVPGIKEFEINPLIVYEKGVLAVDARAVLD